MLYLPSDGSAHRGREVSTRKADTKTNKQLYTRKGERDSNRNSCSQEEWGGGEEEYGGLKSGQRKESQTKRPAHLSEKRGRGAVA
jgi:hypothetical protein